MNHDVSSNDILYSSVTPLKQNEIKLTNLV